MPNWATFAYDQVGNQTNQVDSLNRRTRFEYDALGWRTKEILPGNQSQSYGYDAVGNLTRLTNFNGVVITNQYDALNRLTNKVDAAGISTGYGYDQNGNLTSLKSGTLSPVAFGYDAVNRRTNMSDAGAPPVWGLGSSATSPSEMEARASPSGRGRAAVPCVAWTPPASSTPTRKRSSRCASTLGRRARPDIRLRRDTR